MKTIVAGSRKGVTPDQVRQAMKDAPFEITEVVSGTAQGVDTFGALIATGAGIPVTEFPAKWNDLHAQPCKIKHNRYGAYNALAGHNRNSEMADYADALVAVWNGESPGTRNMIRAMRDRKKLVFVLTV